MKTTKSFMLVIMLCLTGLSYAQTFTEVTPTLTNHTFGTYCTPVMTELDGDNELDLFSGDGQRIALFAQSSTNSTSFILQTTYFNSIAIDAGENSPDFVDLDGDGLLNLIIGVHNGRLYHYEQDAEFSTNFMLQTPNYLQSSGVDIDLGMSGYASKPEFCDIDGNGLIDLLIGCSSGKIYHYEQDGVNSESFTLITSNFNGIDFGVNGEYADPVMGDIDNDDKLDLIIGWANGTLWHYEQDVINGATFTKVTENFCSIDVGTHSSPAFSDFDNDGYLDLMIGEYKNNINYWESNLSTVNYSCMSTTAASSVTDNSATLGGNITDDNSQLIVLRGICYSSSETTPDLEDSRKVMSSGSGSFSGTVDGLTRGTTYYYRAFAISELGIFYGDVKNFTTDGYAPTLTTTDVSSITASTASSGGNITDDGGLSVTERGVCYHTAQNPTTANPHTSDGSGAGVFTSSITGLSPATLYYVRAYATNSVGTSYGEQKSFTTASDVPSVTTNSIINISLTSAEGGGNVTNTNGEAVTARGVCWSTSSNPTTADNFTTNGSGTGEYSSSLTELQGDTRYYVRAYAINSIGTGYGNEVEFYTPNEIINALDFGGSNQNITATLTLPDDGTIEAWVNFDNKSNNGNIFDAGNASSSWYLRYAGNDGYYVKIGTANLIHVAYNKDNEWHHIAVTWNRRTVGVEVVDFYFYIDGNFQSAVSGNVWTAPASTIFIGSSYLPNNFLNGQMDEFRIWNTVRTSTQILDNMHNTLDPSTSGLVCNYRFDQSSGSAATDGTGNGYNGTMNNMQTSVWMQSTAPLGEYGTAVRTNSETTSGNSGSQIKATITAPQQPNTESYMGIYTYGDGAEAIDGETFPSGVTQRADIIWGVEERGDCTANLVFEYGGLSGIGNESTLKLLKRSGATSNWTDVTASATQDEGNNTFTMNDVINFSHFSVGGGVDNPVPVELTSFTAASIRSKERNYSATIQLNWTTATEVDNYGFEIQRQNQVSSIENQDQSQNWEDIGFVEGHGNSNSTKEYSFVDSNPLSGTVEYRLKQIDTDGSFEYSEIIEVELDLPTKFELAQNYPNPFNPSTTISYALPFESKVRVEIFNVLGQRVDVIANGVESAGLTPHFGMQHISQVEFM